MFGGMTFEPQYHRPNVFFERMQNFSISGSKFFTVKTIILKICSYLTKDGVEHFSVAGTRGAGGIPLEKLKKNQSSNPARV
jgi:hypothetical protein